MRTCSTIAFLAGSLLVGAAVFQPLGAQTDLTVTGVNYNEDGEAPFTMYMKGGQMRIDQPGGKSMIFRSGGDQPGMLFIDHEKERVDFLPSEMVNPAESAISAETVVTYETDPEVLPGMEALAPIPQTVTIVRGDSREVVPVNLTKVGFHYEGEATLPGMDQANVPANMKDMLKVIMRVESRAAVDPSLPGADVAAAFYEEMVESGMSAPPSFSSMSAGLMAVNRDIAKKGFPVWVGNVTRVRVSVEGPMAQAMQGMIQGMPGMGPQTSASVIETISTDPVDQALFYNGGMPPDYDVNVLDLAGASR